MTSEEKKKQSSDTKGTEGSSKPEGGVSGRDGAPKPMKRKREKKQLPSVGDMLAYGAPEDIGREKTWCEIIGYPLALAVTFAISLLIFHHAPHHLSKGTSTPPFVMNKRAVMNRAKLQRQQQQIHQEVVPEPNPVVVDEVDAEHLVAKLESSKAEETVGLAKDSTHDEM